MEVCGKRETGFFRVNLFLCKPYRFALDHPALPLLSVAVNTDPRWMSYPLREKEPLLQFLPTILATWIVDNLSEELEMPNPAQPSADERRHHFEDHQGRKWSTSSLNWVLQHVLVPANDGSHLAAN